MAAAVWFSSLGLRVQEFRRLSMRDWLIQVVQSSSSHTFDMCLVLIWTLWRTRNELVWNGTQLPPREVGIRAEGWLLEYKKWHSPQVKKID